MSDLPRARQPRGQGKPGVGARPASERSAPSWTVAMRCYNCETLFSLTGIASTSIVSKSDSSQCPACGAASEPYILGALGVTKRHLIVKLERDRG